MAKQLDMVATSVERGLCRVYYKRRGDKKRQAAIYCRYFGEKTVYACTHSGEPSYPINNLCLFEHSEDILQELHDLNVEV